ncbi:MAG: hypothetical protein QM811_29450 [Pirellulales bacterium]
MYPIAEPSPDYEWTPSGFTWSIIAGTIAAIGALGIILAFTFGGKPVYVMPLVFGGAPIVNTFFSLAVEKRELNPINPIFYAGLIMAVIGATTVLIFAPKSCAARRADYGQTVGRKALGRNGQVIRTNERRRVSAKTQAKTKPRPDSRRIPFRIPRSAFPASPWHSRSTIRPTSAGNSCSWARERRSGFP